MKNQKTILIGAFLTMAVVVIFVALQQGIKSTVPQYLVSPEIREANALKIEEARTKAERMKYIDQEWEFAESARKHEAAIKNIPQDALFWNAVAWSILASSIVAFLILVTLAGLTGKQLATANPDALMMIFMTAFPRSKEHWKFLTANARLEQVREKNLALSPQQQVAIIDAEEPLNIALPLVIPPASKCLEMGLISQEGDRFLYGFDTETGEPHFGNLKTAKSDIAIVGGKQRGKTWNAVNLAVQQFYKGAQGVVIDIHSANDKSFTSYMSAWKDKKSLLWCGERKQVKDTLQFIIDEIDRRLAQATYDHRLVIVADECLQLAQIAPELFKESILRVVTEGDKIGMTFIGISHSWQGKRQANEMRDNIFIGISHFAKPGQSNMLFKNNSVAKMTSDLRDGQFILRDELTEVHKLSVPVWDRATLQKMADDAPEHALATGQRLDVEQPRPKLEVIPFNRGKRIDKF